ncbi:MAG TPA: isoprenylcysteine carboxylmethyltransferase family protein, partial [Xanthomonadales bacterium]|nr:isoprenylcysteine carboxylmethyltransferase family protein [Xanthomonadales bacterium]
GQVWRIYAAGVIYKNKQLATTGAYSLVRHPLYLGNFLILVGFAIAGANWVVVLIVIFFFWFYYPAAIRYEDTKLERIFGDAWREWSANTPAMFPTSFGWKANADAEWNARQSLKRNGEFIISVYLLICAAVLLYRSGML